MKTFSKDIIIYCDVQKDHHCEGEIHFVLNWWEGKRESLKKAKEAGWILGKQDICPKCKQQITTPHKVK